MSRHIIAIGLLASCVAGCTSPPDPWGDKPGPRVLVSFAPLYSFAVNVAGDDANVLCLLSTKGPHDYTGPQSDAQKLRKADLFIVNGLGLDDPVARKLHKASGNQKLRLVAVGDLLPHDLLLEGGLCNCGHGEAHSHGDHDAHVWLGLPEAMAMVAVIRDELKTLDPAHAAGYDSRAAAYTEKLKALHIEGQAMLKDKKDRQLISFHGALAYFARSFDLKIVDTVQASAGVEPGVSRLKSIIQIAKENKVRVIATEPQYTDKNAGQTIVAELKRSGINAETVPIDPLETADTADLTADLYEKRIRANLELLAKAMQ